MIRKIWRFLQIIKFAFQIVFLKSIKQIHNEDQETDKQKFARIPIGIYPMQYFVTMFQQVFDGQKAQFEVVNLMLGAMNDLADAIKAQHKAIKLLINVHVPIDKLVKERDALKRKLDELQKK